MGSDIGPMWDLSEATLVLYGLPLWGHMGFANEFGMGPTRVQIWTQMGPIWDNAGPIGLSLWCPFGVCKLLWHWSHMGSDMGPAWDLFGTTWVPYGLPLWNVRSPMIEEEEETSFVNGMHNNIV